MGEGGWQCFCARFFFVAPGCARFFFSPERACTFFFYPFFSILRINVKTYFSTGWYFNLAELNSSAFIFTSRIEPCMTIDFISTNNFHLSELIFTWLDMSLYFSAKYARGVYTMRVYVPVMGASTPNIGQQCAGSSSIFGFNNVKR